MCVCVILTCSISIETSVMENAGIQFQANDSKYNNGEENKKGYLKQRGHGFQYGFQHHLKT